MQVCKKCAEKYQLRRAREWASLGVCPICGELHLLYNLVALCREQVMSALMDELIEQSQNELYNHMEVMLYEWL